MISAIIVAAGSSQRMGFDKLSADLGAMPVIARTILAFENCDEVSEIVVVTSPERFDFIREYQSEKVKHIIEGGTERHFSVWNGIQVTSDEHPLIAVHDGARPLVSSPAIKRCAEVALDKGAATLAHRIVDTLKRATPGGTTAAESVSREDLWAMETPQIFRREILIPAYEKIIASNQSVTDEVSAIQVTGGSIHFVENSEPNLKITVAGDLDFARSLLSSA